jgi:hypothetical protein
MTGRVEMFWGRLVDWWPSRREIKAAEALLAELEAQGHDLDAMSRILGQALNSVTHRRRERAVNKPA